MKRFEQMEQRRFEQQVAPDIDRPVPAPVRGPVRIEPPNTRLPDLAMIQTALRDGARLTAQLAGYAQKAQEEADELALIDFNGWIKTEQTRRSAEFAKLPLAERERRSEEYRNRFAADAKSYAAKLDFSSRRRQVVDRLIPAHADQFGAQLYAESIRQMERNNIDRIVAGVKDAIASSDVEGAGVWWDKAAAKGIDVGMTREQAISRACYNNLVGQLSGLSTGELSRRSQVYAEMLEGEQAFYEIENVKIARKDLQRLRANADTVCAEKERKETYDFLARVEDGTNELTLDDLKNMRDTLSDRQFVQWSKVLRAQNARAAKLNREAEHKKMEAAAVVLKRSADNTVFSGSVELRNRQLREFEDRAVELLGSDPVLLTKTMREIEKIAKDTTSGKSVWNTPDGEMTRQYLNAAMEGKQNIYSLFAIPDKYKNATMFDIPEEARNDMLIRQGALNDVVKNMLADGKKFPEIKKVIDEERWQINSPAVSEYLTNPGRRFEIRKDGKTGRRYYVDVKTRQVIGPVKEKK